MSTHSEIPLQFKKKHLLKINDTSQSLYYHFDYSERTFDVNTPFQHLHSFYQIMIPLSPGAFHYIKGIPYALQPNDLVLLQPSMFHRCEYPKDTASQRLSISFLYPSSLWGIPETYGQLLKPFHSELPIYRFYPNQRNLINKKLNRICQDSFQEENTGLKTLMVHQMFVDFLYTLHQILPYNSYTETTPKDSTAHKIFTIANYIHKNYSEPLTLEALANIFYISPYYLSHQFKEVTGYTVTQYIQQTRILNVQYQLLNTEKKIALLAADCGFTSFSQFNRIFRKYCSQSPSDFRRNRSSEGWERGASPESFDN